jgi:hypothetical protein
MMMIVHFKVKSLMRIFVAQRKDVIESRPLSMVEGHLLVFLPVLKHDEVVTFRTFFGARAAIALVLFQIAAADVQFAIAALHLPLWTLLGLSKPVHTINQASMSF